MENDKNNKNDKNDKNITKTNINKKYDDFIKTRRNRVCVFKIVDDSKFNHIIKKKVKINTNVSK